MVISIHIHLPKMARKLPWILCHHPSYKIKPQKSQNQSDLLLTYVEPLLKAPQHEFKALKDWILQVQDEPETPLPSHPIAKAILNQFSLLFPDEIPDTKIDVSLKGYGRTQGNSHQEHKERRNRPRPRWHGRAWWHGAPVPNRCLDVPHGTRLHGLEGMSV